MPTLKKNTPTKKTTNRQPTDMRRLRQKAYQSSEWKKLRDIYMKDYNLIEGTRKVELEKEDLQRIGCQTYGDWVLCYERTAAIEQILLSSILKCFGEGHCIEEIETYTPEESPNEMACVKFYTSLEY